MEIIKEEPWNIEKEELDKQKIWVTTLNSSFAFSNLY